MQPISDASDDSGIADESDILVVGNLQLSPSYIDFGVSLIDTVTTNTVVLTNIGSQPLTISSAFLDGDAAFSLFATAPLVLDGEQEAVFEIEFTPTAEQTFDGELNVLVSGHADMGLIPLFGEGSHTSVDQDGDGDGELSLSATEIDFGVVDISTTAVEMVTVTNNGTADIMLTDIATTAVGIVTGEMDLPALLSPGDQRELGIVYTPQEEVITSAVLTIENDSSTAPSISVTGEGFQNCTFCAPVLSVYTGGSNNTSMDQFSSSFGMADTHTLTLQNNGDEPLEIYDINVTNDTNSFAKIICGTAGSYTIAGSTAMSIAPYESGTIEVSYSFTGTGICGEVCVYPINNENTLTISSNDPNDSEFIVTLGGNGFGL